MVRYTLDKIYCKILFWGINGAGKNTAVDALFYMAKDAEFGGEFPITFSGPMTRIPLNPMSVPAADNPVSLMGELKSLFKQQPSNATNHDIGIFFDRGVFQSTADKGLYFHAYTFSDNPSLRMKLSKSLFRGTDGVVLVIDGQRSRWDENVESASFLKKLAGDKLLQKIPLTVLLTKVDLPDAISSDEVQELLSTEGLWQDPSDPSSAGNPTIFEANLLEEHPTKVYDAFIECARKVGAIQTQSKTSGTASEKSTRINLIIPETLKTEWERFSGEVVHASMSQMIRDAVRAYMKKMQQSNPQLDGNTSDEDGNELEKLIERIVTKKLNAVLKKRE